MVVFLLIKCNNVRWTTPPSLAQKEMVEWPGSKITLGQIWIWGVFAHQWYNNNIKKWYCCSRTSVANCTTRKYPNTHCFSRTFPNTSIKADGRALFLCIFSAIIFSDSLETLIPVGYEHLLARQNWALSCSIKIFCTSANYLNYVWSWLGWFFSAAENRLF